jgi:hypothetical protein
VRKRLERNGLLRPKSGKKPNEKNVVDKEEEEKTEEKGAKKKKYSSSNTAAVSEVETSQLTPEELYEIDTTLYPPEFPNPMSLSFCSRRCVSFVNYVDLMLRFAVVEM